MLTGQIVPKVGQGTLPGLDVARYPKKVQAQIGVPFETTNLHELMSGAVGPDRRGRHRSAHSKS